MKRKAMKLRCPKGHHLPHVAANGSQCTPLVCIEAPHAEALVPVKAKTTIDAVVRSRALEAQSKQSPDSFEARAAALAEEENEKHELKLQVQKSKRAIDLAEQRRALREKLVPVPKFKDTKESEEWTQRKIVEMAPVALAEIEYQLLYGDNSERIAAARDFMDSNGLRRRDALQGGGNTIILQMSSAVPWQQQLSTASTFATAAMAQNTQPAAQRTLESGVVTHGAVTTGKTHSGQEAAVQHDVLEVSGRPVASDARRGQAAGQAPNEPDPSKVYR